MIKGHIRNLILNKINPDNTAVIGALYLLVFGNCSKAAKDMIVTVNSDCCGLIIEIRFIEFRVINVKGIESHLPFTNISTQVNKVLVIPSLAWMLKQPLCHCVSTLYTSVNWSQAFVHQDIQLILFLLHLSLQIGYTC